MIVYKVYKLIHTVGSLLCASSNKTENSTTDMLHPDMPRNCTYDTKTVSKAKISTVSQTGRRGH